MFRLDGLVRRRYLQARSMRMAVLVMLPAPRRQQPTTPVQKATKSKKKDTMKRAIMARPISAYKPEQNVSFKNKLYKEHTLLLVGDDVDVVVVHISTVQSVK